MTCASAYSQTLGSASWLVDTSKSSLHFVSIKNTSVAENFTFSQLQGTVASNGTATLTIPLTSVLTGIDLRNTRMQNLLFETSMLPNLHFTTQLNLTAIDTLAVGSVSTQTFNGNLTLHGVTQAITFDATLLKLSATNVSLTPRKPILINSADFDLNAGIEALRSVAGAINIAERVPVYFKMSLTKSNPTNVPAIALTAPPVAPQSLKGTISQVTGLASLTWADVNANETGFIVRRKGSDARWISLTKTAPNTVTYDDSLAAIPGAYEYKVISLIDSIPSAPTTAVALTYTKASSASSTNSVINSSVAKSSSSAKSSTAVQPGNAATGATLFAAQCAGCHAGGALFSNIPARVSNNTLISKIDLTMPQGNPANCVGQCAADVAAYVANQFGAKSSSSVAKSSSSAASSTPVASVDCSNMQTLMQSAELNCTNSSCHAASPSQAAKFALTGTLEEIAHRLGNVNSVNSKCGGEKVIDLNNPSNSLLLKLVDPNSGTQCAQKMPFGTSTGVSPAHFQCFQKWVGDIAAAADIPEPPATKPFEPTRPFNALNKVKLLLHGGAVTGAELNKVSPAGTSLDQTALKKQITDWMATPEFEVKFKSFLQLALQQKNVNPDTQWRNQFDVLNNAKVMDGVKLISTLEESFVRTAYKIFTSNKDFRTVATTREWEVTTAILTALSYADYEARFPFGTDLRSFANLCGDNDGGGVDETAICSGIDDYSDWRTVRLVQGTSRAAFSDTQGMVSGLRAIPAGGSYSLYAPRVGFFTTPAFFQSWESNTGNSFRVTANQTMIAGLGLTFEAGDITPSGDQSAIDNAHAGPNNAECYACHRMMDPMRQVFKNSYHVFRSRALTTPTKVTAAFAFHGSSAPLNSLDDLGKAIFNHPNFANAWVGKMCNWANSAPCDSNSAEYLRLVEVFKNSGYKLKTLAVELFASPMITGVSYTDAFAEAGPSVVINRTNHFCASIKARLDQVRASQGLPPSTTTNVCNLSGTARAKAGLLPEDEFSRGSIDLIQSVNIDPFLTMGYRQLCETAGNSLVSFNAGATGTNYEKIFNASNPTRSLDEMTTYIMGIPPESAEWSTTRAALKKMYDIQMHQTNCTTAGLDIITANQTTIQCGMKAANAVVALKEVWTFACSAPSVMAMGF